MTMISAVLAPMAPQAAELMVRTHTRLTVAARTQGRRVLVTGSLRDNVFQGIAERPVDLALSLAGSAGTEPRTLRRPLETDRNGRFGLSELLPDGAWSLTAVYPGDELHAGSEAGTSFEVGRESPRVDLDVPVAAPIWADLPISIRVIAPTGPGAALPLGVAVDGRATRLGLLTDERGEAHGRLEALPHLGDVRVTASFTGNHLFAPAQASTLVRLYREAELTLDARPEELREARLLLVRGELTSDVGPIASATVGLQVVDRAVSAGATTNRQGRFELVVPISQLEPGQTYTLGATFDPHGSSVPDLRVEATVPFHIRSSPLEKAHQWAMVAAGALLALLIVGLAAARAAGWWRQRGRRRRPAERPGRAAPDGLVELSPQRPGAGRRDDRVSGVVLDADTAAPVAQGEVIVELMGQDRPVVFPVATDGSFSTPPLPEGRHRVTVRVAGYVSTGLHVNLPHRGRYSGIEVYVCSVRSWIRHLYREMTVELGLDDEGQIVWGRATPHQIEARIVDAWRAFSGTDSGPGGIDAFRERIREILEEPSAVPSERVLRALTLLVEEVYYSGRVYAEEMIDLCRSLIYGVQATVAEARASESRAGSRESRVES